MCGFAGFFMAPGAPLRSPQQMAAMVAQLRQRGPDAQHGVAWNAEDQRVEDHPLPLAPARRALLHARLAIIDPTPEADQPMVSDDGQVWLCYNGEVYGWESAARRLVADGQVFRTRADTEFILRAYLQWGWEKTLAQLRGMYAIALYDRRIGKVFLARDAMGKKPLLYRVAEHGADRGLIFASTLRALLPALTSNWQFSPSAIDAYLAHRTIPAPNTVVEGVQRLPNGHWAVYDLATHHLSLHAQPAIEPRQGDWQASLDEAVGLRTVADRPVGLFLSGGVDSAVIASRLVARGQKLKAFTAAFPGSSLDETAAATRTATLLGLEHEVVPVPTSIRDDFPAIVAGLDEPFADPSAIPLWYLAQAATREVKVVLSGDGGDELFAGYKRYRQHLRSAWRRGLRWPMAWKPALEDRGWPKLRQELAMDWREAYCLRFSGFSPAQRCFLQLGLTSLPATHWRLPPQDPSPLASLLAIDMANYLPEYILRKADLTTMAHGLECRSPLLDTDFYAHVLALAPTQRFTQPAKQLLATVMPPSLAEALFLGKKHGFNPPLENWLREDLKDRCEGLGVRLSQLAPDNFDGIAVDRFIEAYQQGNDALAEGVLQLLLLDESLRQLSAFCRQPT
ncbi:amidotransferase 1, exosortase A system-associated [Denitratisoma sp. agr-D3]